MNSRKRNTIPVQCRDQPIEKEKSTRQLDENDIIQLFGGEEKKVMNRANADDLEDIARKLIENESAMAGSKHLDQYYDEIEKIHARKDKRYKALQETYDAQNNENEREKSGKESKKEYDGKIELELDADKAKRAKKLLKKLHEFLNVKEETKAKSSTKNENEEEEDKDVISAEGKITLRVKPAEAKLLEQFLNKSIENVPFIQEISDEDALKEYILERYPHLEVEAKLFFKKIKKPGNTESTEEGDGSATDNEKLIEALKLFKLKKRKYLEKFAALALVGKKDFDVIEFESPNPHSLAKTSSQPFFERSMYYEDIYKFHKKRDKSLNRSVRDSAEAEGAQFEAELLYLHAFWELLHPGDYVLKCDFYNVGVKINRERLVAKDAVLEAVVLDLKISEIYGISGLADAERRLKDLKTINTDYLNFREFVEFLYLDKNVKKISDQAYAALYAELNEALEKEKQANEEGVAESDPEDYTQQEMGVSSNKRSKSAKHNRLTTNFDELSEYPIKVTVPIGPEMTRRATTNEIEANLLVGEEGLASSLDRQNTSDSAYKFKPKEIPEAVRDRSLWSRMVEEAEEKRESRKKDSVANTIINERPFSFYEKDPNPLKRREEENRRAFEEHLAQKLNNSEGESSRKKEGINVQLSMDYAFIMREEEERREERRNARRTVELKVHEKLTTMQLNSAKLIEEFVKKHPFRPEPQGKKSFGDLPDFKHLHDQFSNALQKAKLGRQNTQIEEFKLGETLKGPDYKFMDTENLLQKHTKERPGMDPIEKAHNVINRQPNLIPHSTKKFEELEKERTNEKLASKEKEDIIKKEESKREVASKRLAPELFDALQNTNEIKAQEEEERRKGFLDSQKQLKKANEREKQERETKLSEEPLIVERDNQLGLEFPFNRIFRNYEFICRDVNIVKQMRKTEDWEGKHSAHRIKEMAEAFIARLDLKKKNALKDLKFPWNLLLKDGDTDITLYLVNHENQSQNAYQKTQIETYEMERFKERKQNEWSDKNTFELADQEIQHERNLKREKELKLREQQEEEDQEEDEI